MPLVPRPQTLARASHTLLRSPAATTNINSFTTSQSGLLRTVATSSSQSQAPTPVRTFSSTSKSLASGHGDAHAEHGEHSHYDPPTGWLWGQPPGTKYEKEGWENIWYWGFYGSLVLTAVAYAFKPDTNIETWALEEARRRLQAEGTLPDDD